MKRLSGIIISILSLFFIVSFFAPKQTLAQPTNKFDCKWISGFPGTCIVDIDSIKCAPGFCTNPLDCAVTFESSCLSKVGQDCVPCATPPPSVGKVDIPIFCVANDPTFRTTINTGKLATAIGCISIREGQEFTSFFLGWGIGIGGGIAFLLILYAGFMIMTSSGDPKKLQAGKELLTSAIAGLLLLIFSVFILRLIGVDILGLPGFGV